MLRSPVRIDSRDPISRAEIEVDVTAHGDARWSPEEAVVFVGGRDADHSISDLCCPVVNFFASAQTPRQYVDAHPDLNGRIVSIPRTRHLRGGPAVTTPFAEAALFRLRHAPLPTDLVAKYFRGLGDTTRLRVLELLRDESELTAGRLVERLGVPQPKVSNHLACLRWCGFIEARREHRTVYNRIADERVLEMLDLAHALLADNEEHVAACCRIEERSGG